MQGPADSNEPLHRDGQGDVDGDTEGHSRHRVKQEDVQLEKKKITVLFCKPNENSPIRSVHYLFPNVGSTWDFVGACEKLVTKKKALALRP